MKSKIKGKKYDQDKTDWSLLPWREVEQVVRVLMFGAERYGRFDWQHFVARGKNEERYFAAAVRHLTAWKTGHKLDPETNLHHLAHALCCIIFVLWKETNGRFED
jgi:hypothetical protein